MSIGGLEVVQGENFAYVVISEFSDDLKRVIEKYLIEICHGKVGVTSRGGLFTFEKTLKELLHRYPASDTDKQVGFMGELLAHVMIRIINQELNVVSPFFNMEAAESAKRGFDIILFDSSNNSLYFLESKSGSVNDDVTRFAVGKIHEAKRDLVKRLNDSDRKAMWYNAYNNVRICLSDNTDEKDAVIDILNGISCTNASQDKNVILSAGIFGRLNGRVDDKSILMTKNDITNSNIFSSIRIMVIHKETYQKIYEFLEELSNECSNEAAES